MLDESLAVLRAAWSGQEVDHVGRHVRVTGAAFGPPPQQGAGLPVWVAGFAGRQRPIRRAAAHDGYFPVNLEHPDQLAEAVAHIRVLRESGCATGGFDVIVSLEAGADPAAYVDAGATWWLPELDPEAVTVDAARGVLARRPLPLTAPSQRTTGRRPGRRVQLSGDRPEFETVLAGAQGGDGPRSPDGGAAATRPCCAT